MMNPLYRVISSSEYCFTVELNTDSDILDAHFPERAIVPGSCLIDIARELAENIIGKKLYINKLKNTKFINLIEPSVVRKLFFCFENGGEVLYWHVIVKDDEKTFAKMSILFSYE